MHRSIEGYSAQPSRNCGAVGWLGCAALVRADVKKVALNAVFLRRRMGGIETYVRELVPALLELEPKLAVAVLVTPSGEEALRDEPWMDEVKIASPPILRLPLTKAISELTVVGLLADRLRADVIHSVAMIGPVHSAAASVVTIPDVTWWRDRSAVPRSTRLLWRTCVPIGARHAQRVVTLSQVAAQEISEDLSIPQDRIDVVPLGPGTRPETESQDGSRLRAQWDLGDGPIILAVSGLSPHKNVEVAIDAMAAIRARRPNAVLVVPGNVTAYASTLTARARALGVEQIVRFPGWVSSAQLEGLYQEASCLVFPSRREGFGLPLLEAMARGLPVICAHASAMPEVAGDAALYFDPDSADDLARAVDRVLSDDALAEDLAAAGRQRAAQFSWRRAAEEHLQIYERAVRER